MVNRWKIAHINTFAVCCALLGCTFMGLSTHVYSQTPRRNIKGKASSPVVRANAPQTASANNFMKAKSFFDAARYDVAIQFAAADLRQNPGRRASVVLMAQAYYRMGNAARAGKLFSSLKLEEIPPEASIDYALALFASRRYTQAAVAWKIVPQNHPYRDVTVFYGGVSNMFLRQYARASTLLRQARKLPASLKSERRRLLDEAEAVLARSREGLFAQDQAFSSQPLPQYLPPPQMMPAPVGPSAPAGSKPTAAPPPPVTGFMFSAVPTVTYELSSERLDYNGFAQKQTDFRIPTASMPTSLKYTAAPRSFGGQPYLTVNATPGYSDTERTDTTSALFAPVENPTAVQSSTKRTETHFYSQSLLSSVEALYPVSAPLDILVNYKSDHFYADASLEKDRSVSGPTGKVSIEGDRLRLDASYSSLTTDDQANLLLEKPLPTHVKTDDTIQVVFTRNGNSSVAKLDVSSVTSQPESKSGLQSALLGKASVDKTFGEFNLGVGGIYNSRTTFEKTILTDPAAPRLEQGATANLVWSGTFGIIMTFGLAYTLFDDLEFKASDEEGTIYPSSGTVTTYSLLASLPIFGTYGGVDFAYRYSDRKITPPEGADEAIQLSILTGFWSQRTATSIKFTAKYPL